MDKLQLPRSLRLLALLLAAGLWACGGGEGDTSSAGSPEDATGGRQQVDPGPQAEPGPDSPPPTQSGIPEGGIEQWVRDIRTGLEDVKLNPRESQQRVLQLYVTRQEYIEMFYGPGGQITGNDHPELAEAVTEQETRFHELMQLTGSSQQIQRERILGAVTDLENQLSRTMELAREAGVPLDRGSEQDSTSAGLEDPDALLGSGEGEGGATAEAAASGSGVSMPEIRSIIARLDDAEAAYESGDTRAALAGVEEAYLEGFEPLESRLAQSNVQRVERLIHLSLRPRIAREAPADEVAESFAAVRSELRAADRAVLEAGSSFWFGAFNSLIIILREGLEAVLLVGALLAYLAKVEGGREQHPRIWAGVGLGVAASFATWFAARWLIPVSGGNRELLEGITALVAVGVLIYVSNWIFQRSYIHHWKDFLKEKMDTALTTGSAVAMAALAFAAVYREGFETVLFYQALMFDVGTGPVLAGFLPGLVLILAVGAGIIKLGLRLPLKQVFAGTNLILIYLAVVFTGKGIYNLQEAGLFAPHPVGWVPSSEALRLGLGVYPVAETLIAQAVVIAGVGATYVYYRKKSAAKAAEAKARKAEAEVRTAEIRSSGRSEAEPRPTGSEAPATG